MESTPDLAVAVTGMINATITRYLGPEVVQEFRTEVRGGPSAHGSPAPLEVVLAYGGRSLRRTIVVNDVPDRLELETAVSSATLTMLQEMGLVPRGAGQRT
jgi:hypothetical protein